MKKYLQYAIFTLIAILVVFMILFPVFYIFEISLKPSGALATTEIDLIPEEVTLDNYREVMIGHMEATTRGNFQSLRAEEFLLRMGENRRVVKNGTITIIGQTTITLTEPTVVEVRGGDEREGDNSKTIVNGEYALLHAREASIPFTVDNLMLESIDGKEELNGVLVERATNVELELENFRSFRMTKVGGDIWGSIKNSTILALFTVLFSLLFVVPGAYAFSRLRFSGKGHILYFYLMFTQVSGGLGIAGLIALYGLLIRLNLMNSLYGIALVYASASVPYNTWLLKTYFDSIPFEFDEAAFVDGANYLQVIRHIILPVAMPGIATVAIFAFMGGWTELVLANLLLPAHQPLSVNLYVLLQDIRSIQWSYFAATALIFAMPPALMFMLAQRFIRGGLTLGGLKG